MTFGAGLPDLFRIAFISFLTLYIVEKGMLYYGYREPPHYSEVLNNSVLEIMVFVPVMLLGFGYWMLSNK